MSVLGLESVHLVLVLGSVGLYYAGRVYIYAKLIFITPIRKFRKPILESSTCAHGSIGPYIQHRVICIERHFWAIIVKINLD